MHHCLLSYVRVREQYLTRIKNLREAHLSTAVGTVLTAQAKVGALVTIIGKHIILSDGCRPKWAAGIMPLCVRSS